MKGIILAGGAGTRLHPSTLMLAGIKEILIISTPQDLPNFERLLGTGEEIGCKFSYVVQEIPNGLAQAFVLGADFIGDDSACLILGDNIFYGNGLSEMLQTCKDPSGGIVFAYPVNDPERYGVVEFDDELNAKSIEEKPSAPKSNYAVPGLYFYDNSVVKVARELKPSARGEYEITDVNKYYLEQGNLSVRVMSRGFAWLDTGTHASLLQAGEFVRVIEDRQGLKVGCIEEVAWQMGFIDDAQLKVLGDKYIKSGYGAYLHRLLK